MARCTPRSAASRGTIPVEEFREEMALCMESLHVGIQMLFEKFRDEMRQGVREDLEHIFQAYWSADEGPRDHARRRRGSMVATEISGVDEAGRRSVKFRPPRHEGRHHELALAERPHIWRGRTLRTWYTKGKTLDSLASETTSQVDLEVDLAGYPVPREGTYVGFPRQHAVRDPDTPDLCTPAPTPTVPSRRSSLRGDDSNSPYPSRRGSLVSNMSTGSRWPSKLLRSGTGSVSVCPGDLSNWDLRDATAAANDAGGHGNNRSRGMVRHRLEKAFSRPSSLFGDGDLEDAEMAQLMARESTLSARVVCTPTGTRAFSMRLPQPVYVMPPRGSFHELCANFVQSQYFEHGVGFLVLLNAVALGLETDFQATHRQLDLPAFLNMSELFFCFLFLLELMLKLFVYRGQFLSMDAWQWNIFDTVVVSMQVLEQVTIWLRASRRFSGVSHLRIVRVLRLIRITRIIRVLRLQEELRTIVTSIMSSMESLGWTLLLLAMTVYIFAVVMTQMVAECSESENFEALQYWFGSLPRSILTMFESIVGGATWDAVVAPLITDVSPILGFVFCFFIIVCVFAIMNVVTAAFVEKATRTAQEDKDMYLANHITDLFFVHAELGDQQHITWEEFSAKLVTKEMQEYFRQINLDPSEARGIFELLDTDGSGSVDPEEIVHGCLRLRGSAKALELSLLMHECNRMHQRIDAHQETVERQLATICQILREEM